MHTWVVLQWSLLVVSLFRSAVAVVAARHAVGSLQWVCGLGACFISVALLPCMSVNVLRYQEGVVIGSCDL